MYWVAARLLSFADVSYMCSDHCRLSKKKVFLFELVCVSFCFQQILPKLRFYLNWCGYFFFTANFASIAFLSQLVCNFASIAFLSQLVCVFFVHSKFCLNCVSISIGLCFFLFTTNFASIAFLSQLVCNFASIAFLSQLVCVSFCSQQILPQLRFYLNWSVFLFLHNKFCLNCVSISIDLCFFLFTTNANLLRNIVHRESFNSFFGQLSNEWKEHVLKKNENITINGQ